MAVFLIGKGNKPHKAHYTSVLTEPSSYDADITPENMQRGMSAYAKGKKVIGTGKCFEFAEYGLYRVKKLDNGYYGIAIELGEGANTFFIVPTGKGDIVVQTANGIEVGNEPEKIGENTTSEGDVLVSYVEGQVMVYITKITSTSTTLRVFIGKDNEV